LGRILRGRGHLKNLNVGVRVIKTDFRGKGAWTGVILLRIGSVTGCCVHGDEHSSSVKSGEYLDELRNC